MLPAFEKFANEPARIVALVVRAREAEESSVPIAYLLVERKTEEKYAPVEDEDKPLVLEEAHLVLNYFLLKPSEQGFERSGCGGSFGATYKAGTGIFLTDGIIDLKLDELYGQRIGTYLMSQIVHWAKRWPEADVQTIELLSRYAQEGNLERRNQLFEKLGMSFDYQNLTKTSGLSRPMKAKVLLVHDSWKKNITELDPRALIAGLMHEKDALYRALVAEQIQAERLRRQIHLIKSKPLRLVLEQLPPSWPNIVLLTLLGSVTLIYWLVR